MTYFELTYLMLERLLPPLHRKVRIRLNQLVAQCPVTPAVLDVGGRKSHYTIGLPARITVSDLPRESIVQHQLNLGINDSIASQTLRRRSNVSGFVYDDLTRSKLPENSFDIIVAVEVLEHVEQDSLFLENVGHLLKSGGWFLMTTPNGDSVPIPHNVDHKRHYRRAQLAKLLSEHLHQVSVSYCVRASRFRSCGLKSWSIRHPIVTALSMAGNIVNAFESADGAVSQQHEGTRHLLAIARKANPHPGIDGNASG
jgi:SAM-dependent methyltransferase